MSHQERYRTDPSSLKSLYFVHHLTLQRLCEHSSAVKLTLWSIKGLLLWQNPQNPALSGVDRIILQNIHWSVRKRRWAGRWNAQHETLFTRALIRFLTLHLSYSRSQMRGGGSEVKMEVHSAFISAYKTVIHYPRRKEKAAADTDDCDTQDALVWQIVCSIHFQRRPSSRVRIVELDKKQANWIDQRWGILAGRIYCSRTHELIQHRPTRWLNMCCWFLRRVQSKKKIPTRWCHALFPR